MKRLSVNVGPPHSGRKTLPAASKRTDRQPHIETVADATTINVCPSCGRQREGNGLVWYNSCEEKFQQMIERIFIQHKAVW